VPKEVVRGIQLGLGITLATLALRDYTGADGLGGYLLAALCVALLLLLPGQRRVPAPLVVMALGVAYAGVLHLDREVLSGIVGLRLPVFHAPTRSDLLQGALLLALPQIPLSLGNSVIATSQTTADLFPGRGVPVRKIGFTYGLMNLVAPWFGGVPVCHGCGGLVGFYGFGARTGGAPVIYGALYLLLGLFFAPGFARVVHVFPMPVLGVVLLFEAVALMSLVRDVAGEKRTLWVALLVAAAVVGLPYGYGVGLVVGTLVSLGLARGWVAVPGLAVPANDDAPAASRQPTRLG
jgi:MFS superfamily sulfate permease-like transporter